MRVRRPWLVAPRTIEYREEEIELTPETVLVRHVCTAPSTGTAIYRYRGEETKLAAYNRQESFVFGGAHPGEKRAPPSAPPGSGRRISQEEGGAYPYPWLQGFAYGVGRIEQLGEKVRALQVGQLVYSQKLTAELSVVAPADLVPLPPGVEPEWAALLFQAQVALRGARAAQIVLGDYVLVTGLGTIGNFTAQLCKLGGAYRVLATDLSAQRLALALRVGVDLALDARAADTLARIQEYTFDRGADVVIESSGAPPAFKQGCAAAAKFARIVVVGWILAPFQFNVSDAFTPKGLEMVVCHSGQPGDWRLAHRQGGSKGGGGDRAYLLNLMAEGKLQAAPLITHRLPYADLVAAWADVLDKQLDTYVQVVFTSEAQ